MEIGSAARSSKWESSPDVEGEPVVRELRAFVPKALVPKSLSGQGPNLDLMRGGILPRMRAKRAPTLGGQRARRPTTAPRSMARYIVLLAASVASVAGVIMVAGGACSKKNEAPEPKPNALAVEQAGHTENSNAGNSAAGAGAGANTGAGGGAGSVPSGTAALAPAGESAPDFSTAAGPKAQAQPQSDEHRERFARLVITSTLEAAAVQAVGADEGVRLAQVAKRALVWWVNLGRDLWPNDTVELVYELRGAEEPVVHAIWLESRKLAVKRAAVLYTAQQSSFARWYDEAGQEIELRLKDSPLKRYEQVTSLLSDGRGHRGVDFKTPVGTPVLAPFSGRVTRRNWSRRRNGNCLEIQDSKTGRRAIFLHLDRIEGRFRPGQKVTRGQKVAYTGNTGRSSAPHLHYQLELGRRILDPFKVHRTWRESLPASEKPAVQKLFVKYGAMRQGST